MAKKFYYKLCEFDDKERGWGILGTEKAVILASSKKEAKKIALREYGKYWYMDYFVENISPMAAGNILHPKPPPFFK